MKVEYSARARRDLELAEAEMAARSPSGARRVLLRLAKRIHDLVDMPFQGRISRVAGARELVVTRTPYIVFYNVTDDVVTILTVRHAARKPLG
ncbi:MAG: type II toxin-antitoxin system RelE/ParE family toxin [Hyphomonadaceae bacterium]|nr:type II toxin-antitoxin system RelE/ParE family toxin [Hyphomonadaceae bacterium]